MRKVTAPVLAAVIGAALLFFSGAPVQASAACPAGEPPGRPPGQNGSRPGNTGRSTQYPPGGCQLLLSLNAASSTTAVHVSGSGFSPHSGVQVAMAGQNRIGATTDADGTFVTDFVVPSVDPGDYTVTASGTDGSGPRVLAAAFTVTAPSSTAAGPPSAAAGAVATGGTPAGTLSTTGSSYTFPLTFAALLLIAVGSLAMTAAWRRLPQLLSRR